MGMDPKTLEMLQFLAAKNVCDGVLYEPRAFFDTINFGASGAVNPSQGNPNVFRNGEQYPIRITHLVSAIRYTGTTGTFPVGDERAIQRYGIRIKGHDTYYMNPGYAPLPLWHNVPTAASDVITRGQSTWKFWKPFYMGHRDTIEIKGSLIVGATASNTRRLAVAFEGVGALSRRPKKLYGFYDFTFADGTLERAIPTDFFRNDGTEPLEIRQMSVSVGGLSLAADPVGEIRVARLSAKLIGNGTNQRWNVGPNLGAVADFHMPGPLWGPTTGRAVIHELPAGSDGHPGWIWYPGEGVSFEVQQLASRTDQIDFGLLGHAIIK
jgi:hypothetical protein